MRILLSTKHYGGAGGIQRHVASTIRCLSGDHEIDVFARKHEPGEYSARPAHGRIVPAIRWRRLTPRRPAVGAAVRVAQTLLRYRPKPYDVYLHYQYADWLLPRFPAAVALAIPCGAKVENGARFDAVLLEAPDNNIWVEDTAKSVLLPPPLDTPSDHSEPVPGLPEAFFLTVFNAHSGPKGQADLGAVARRSPIPIVWCRSTLWNHSDPSTLPGVVVHDDLSQAQLRYLYERCRAYISFDQKPGFGWALADALQYGAPALSRGRGVMTLPEVDKAGTRTYDTVDELVTLLHRHDYEHVERDLAPLAPRQFVKRFEELVQSLRESRPSI